MIQGDEKKAVSLPGGLFPHDNAATALLSGEDKHLGNLHVSGCVGGIDGHVSDIVAGQWFNALIDIGGTFRVAVETGVAEIRLHQTGL